MGKDYKVPWEGLVKRPAFLSNLLGCVPVGLALTAGWYLIHLLVAICGGRYHEK